MVEEIIATKSGGSMIVFNDFKKISEVIEIATECGFEYKDSFNLAQVKSDA